MAHLRDALVTLTRDNMAAKVVADVSKRSSLHPPFTPSIILARGCDHESAVGQVVATKLKHLSFLKMLP